MNFLHNGKPKMVSITATVFVRPSIASEIPSMVIDRLKSITFNLKCKMMEKFTKRRYGTARFSLNRGQKTFIEHTLNYFQQTLVIDKKVSMETLVEEFEPVAGEDFECWGRRNLIIK